MDHIPNIVEIKRIIERLHLLAGQLEQRSEKTDRGADQATNDVPLAEIRRLSGLLAICLHEPQLQRTLSVTGRLSAVLSDMQSASASELSGLTDRVRSVLGDAPDSMLGVVTMARLALRSGDYQAGVAALLEARRLEPTSPVVRVLLADMLSRAGRSADAVEELRAAITDHPAHVPCYSMLAQILRMTGDAQGAASVLEQGLQKTRGAWDRALLYGPLGDIKLEQGDQSGARSSWEAGLHATDDPTLKDTLARRIAALP